MLPDNVLQAGIKNYIIKIGDYENKLINILKTGRKIIYGSNRGKYMLYNL